VRVADVSTLPWFFRAAWRSLAVQPDEPERPPRPDLEDLRRTQWNDRFEALMRNRLVMGAFRYGTFQEQGACRHYNPAAIQRHLAAYVETGNAEHLVDIANLALVEFTAPSHQRFHFLSLDDGDHHSRRVD
jgi:hypothetical protein